MSASSLFEVGVCGSSRRTPLLPYCALLSVVCGVPGGGGRSLITGLPLLSFHRYMMAASVGGASVLSRQAMVSEAVQLRTVDINGPTFTFRHPRYCDLCFSAISHAVNAQHFLTFLRHLFTMSVVTRTATANDEYPHPLAHPHDGIVMRAVCGFRLVRLAHFGLDTALPRRPTDTRVS